jgi:hypothetical protein
MVPLGRCPHGCATGVEPEDGAIVCQWRHVGEGANRLVPQSPCGGEPGMPTFPAIDEPGYDGFACGSLRPPNLKS